MKGKNIFDEIQRGARTFSHDANHVCIFISHQKKDAPSCRILADFLMSKGIDVYFDEYDKSIDRDNPRSVVRAIQDGLDNSTHTLVILSDNALASSWVPWEVGYSYANRPNRIYALTLKEVSHRNLPDYFKILPVIRGTTSLLTTIMEMPINKDTQREIRWFALSQSYHYPLSQILSVNY